MEQVKKIHNAVFVSNKIITYKVAAALLEISVNEAKKALETYVNDLKDKNEIINVSYVIGGVTVSGDNKVRIVSQKKYETAKTDFNTLTIDHIYSIQKAKLVDWIYVFNVDDFLYDKNEVQADVNIKQEVIDVVEVKKEIKTALPAKKGALSNFLNNTNNKKQSINNKATVKKEVENGNKSKKEEKKTAFTNFFSKSNKENQTKTMKASEEIKSEDHSDDEEIFKVNKKRTRVINDDDFDDETPTKCPKVDILDDLEDQDNESFHSDEDLFGSPEKDEQLMKDTEESSENALQNTVPEIDTENSEFDTETSEMDTETTKGDTQTTEKNTETSENSETMYEDSDGYFVTDKKSNKKSQKSPVNKLSKKETELRKKTDKEDKKTKKESALKIKNNTNQKSILSFFQKK